MDVPTLIDALDHEGRRFSAAIDRGHPGAPVPSCPDWSLRDLVHPWTAEGDASAVAVHGGARDAIGAISGPEVRLSEVGLATALAWLGWAGASGGAHGRRRGAAAGRLDAWMVLAELVDLSEIWPPEPDELGARASRMRWYVWDEMGIGATGWVLRVAVEDPDRGIAFGLSANDPA